VARHHRDSHQSPQSSKSFFDSSTVSTNKKPHPWLIFVTVLPKLHISDLRLLGLADIELNQDLSALYVNTSLSDIEAVDLSLEKICIN
jgi:hypothetical protein